jgi:hypothetical protein
VGHPAECIGGMAEMASAGISGGGAKLAAEPSRGGGGGRAGGHEVSNGLMRTGEVVTNFVSRASP